MSTRPHAWITGPYRPRLDGRPTTALPRAVTLTRAFVEGLAPSPFDPEPGPGAVHLQLREGEQVTVVCLELDRAVELANWILGKAALERRREARRPRVREVA